MSKTKQILAIGIILLFIGITVSPATAKLNIAERLSNFTEKEEKILEEFLPSLANALEGATSTQEAINILEDFIKEWGRHPFLILLLEFLINGLTFNGNINQLRPLRQNAFVISWGFTNKFNPFKDNKLQLYRPITTWYYSGRSDVVVNSRTLIIDPYPFKVISLTGRQIGLMRNFAGLYYHKENTLGSKAYTFFAGRVAGIRGIDLSINPFNQ